MPRLTEAMQQEILELSRRLRQKEREREDAVNHPAHYTQGAMEVIDAIEGMGLSYHEGNIVKYVARWRHKNGVEDLRKAAWYLQRLIDRETAKLGVAIPEEAKEGGDDA